MNLLQIYEPGQTPLPHQDAVAMGIDPPPMAAASAQADDRVLCPHCGRKFADMAAQRHIPKCATQRARPAPPPNRR